MKYLVSGLLWDLYYAQPPQVLGFLPDIFWGNDDRPAVEHVKERYAHGGGWSPFNRFSTKQVGADNRMVLVYPGDPPLRMIAETVHPLTKERIRFFESSWIMIEQPDGSHEISRMD